MTQTRAALPLARLTSQSNVDNAHTARVTRRSRAWWSRGLVALAIAISLLATARPAESGTSAPRLAPAADQWGGLKVTGSLLTGYTLRFRTWDPVSRKLPGRVPVRIGVESLADSETWGATYLATVSGNSLSVVVGSASSDSVVRWLAQDRELRITVATMAPQLVTTGQFVYAPIPPFTLTAYQLNWIFLLGLAGFVLILWILDQLQARKALRNWKPFEPDVTAFVLVPLFLAFLVWAVQYICMCHWPNLQLEGMKADFRYPGNILSLWGFSLPEAIGFSIAGTKLLLLRPTWRRVHPMLPPTQKRPKWTRFRWLLLYLGVLSTCALGIAYGLEHQSVLSVGVAQSLMGIVSLGLLGFGVAREMSKHDRDAVAFMAALFLLAYPGLQLALLRNVIPGWIALLALLMKFGLLVSLISFPVAALSYGRIYSTLSLVFHTLLGPTIRLREQSLSIVRSLEHAGCGSDALEVARAQAMDNFGQAQALAWTASLHRMMLDTRKAEVRHPVTLGVIARDIGDHFNGLARHPGALARALGSLVSPKKIEQLRDLALADPDAIASEATLHCACFRSTTASGALDQLVLTHRDTAGMILRELMVNALRFGTRDTAPTIEVFVERRWGVIAVGNQARTGDTDALKRRLAGDAEHLGLVLCRAIALRYDMELAFDVANARYAPVATAEGHSGSLADVRVEFRIPVLEEE